jgi:hypothetical protein
VRITDISVSRTHAVMKFTKQGFIIEDANSKFGTLIQITHPVEIKAIQPSMVQSGRSFINISLKKEWALFKNCFK